jgi:hypothetical protein
MKKNITKNYVSKIVAVMFWLVMLVYGQYGYAVVERSLYVDRGTGQTYVKFYLEDEGITTKVAEKIAVVLADREHPVGNLTFDTVTFAPGAVAIITRALQTNLTLRIFTLRHNVYLSENDRQVMLDFLAQHRMVIDIIENEVPPIPVEITGERITEVVNDVIPTPRATITGVPPSMVSCCYNLISL